MVADVSLNAKGRQLDIFEKGSKTYKSHPNRININKHAPH